jgi:hypothetical protein
VFRRKRCTAIASQAECQPRRSAWRDELLSRFPRTAAGRHTVKICRAEACQSMGGDAVAEHAKGLQGRLRHETAPDGSVTLEAVYCLGLCACAPAAMVDGKVIGRSTRRVSTNLPRRYGHDGHDLCSRRFRCAGARRRRGCEGDCRRGGSMARRSEIVRNGSRGMYWLEPMVEVATGKGRVAYGPVTASDVASLFEADFLSGGGASSVTRQSGRAAVPEEPDAADLCALRHRRSAVAGGLRGA